VDLEREARRRVCNVAKPAVEKITVKTDKA
jgi:hypothetical protein